MLSYDVRSHQPCRCSTRRSATTSPERPQTFPDREALVECATGRRWTYARVLRSDPPDRHRR